MLLQQALQEQYHAGLALHAAYFTHLYLAQGLDAYQPWPGRPDGCPGLWEKPWSMEPYEMPEDFEVYTKNQLQDYIAYIDALIDPTVYTLDLEAQETDIPWYRHMSELSHELLNLRHLQGHVGQLSELLMARGIDTDWISARRS